MRGHSAIQDWMFKFGFRKKNENPIDKKLILKTTDNDKTIPGEILHNRIKELEQQLEDEKLRTFILDTIINLAEEKLQTDIRKKYGAKQLKK